MRKRAHCLPILFLIVSLSFGQSPVIIGEDISSTAIDIKCLCQPGVINASKTKGIELSYGIRSDRSFRSRDQEKNEVAKIDNFNDFRLGIKIPLILKPNFKLLLSYRYQYDFFRTININDRLDTFFGDLDGERLKSNSFGIRFVVPLSETAYFSSGFTTSFNGVYRGLVDFGSRYAIYNGVVGLGFKKSDNLEWGVGLVAADNFRRHSIRVLPFGFVNYTISGKWGIETIIPTKLKARYNINPNTIMLIGLDYRSSSYSFDSVPSLNGQSRKLAFNDAELLMSVYVQQKIKSWIWIDGTIGFQTNFINDFRFQASNNVFVSATQASSLYFKLGIFITPSAKFVEGK